MADPMSTSLSSPSLTACSTSSVSLLRDAAEEEEDQGDGANVRIGRWTKQEHSRFMEGYKMFGKDWRRVAEYVGTRSNVQVRTHAQKSFKKMRKLELARLKTQKIIAAHRSGLSDAERARVLEQIERATKLAMQQTSPSLRPTNMETHQLLSPLGSPLGSPPPSTNTTSTSSYPMFHSDSSSSAMLGSGLLSPLLLPPHQHQRVPTPMMSFITPLELSTSNSGSSATGTLSSPPPTPPVFMFNGVAFPRLASLPALTSHQLPLPPPARLNYQHPFKFVQDWSVDVK